MNCPHKGSVLAGFPQGKWVRVVAGAFYDVAVDLRRRSEAFGCWVGAHLSASNRHQLWIPPAFAHGFQVLSELAHFVCKATDFRRAECERTLRWDDPDVGIQWAECERPVLAPEDAAGTILRQAGIYG